MNVRTGVIQSTSGATNPPRGGLDGAVLLDMAHGRYQEAVLNGNVYSGCNQTGSIWTVELDISTATGLCLSNTLGSGKVLSILAAGFSERVQPAGIQDVWIACGSSASAVTHTTPGTAYNMLLGSSNTPVGKIDVAYDLPVAPVYMLPIQSGKKSAVLGTSTFIATIDIGGLICLKPGAYATIACFTVGAAVGQMGCFIWEELPYTGY